MGKKAKADYTGFLRQRLSLGCRLALFGAVLSAVVVGSVAPQLAPPGAGISVLLHFVTYATLTVVAILLFERPLFCALVVLGFSGAMEIVQGIVPGRTSSWFDFGVNSAAVVSGAIAIQAWQLQTTHLLRRRRAADARRLLWWRRYQSSR